MARDPHVYAHQQWLGYLQPEGLFVSVPALLHAQAILNTNVIELHKQFLAILDSEVSPSISSFPDFTRTFLKWRDSDLLGSPGADPIPGELEVVLPTYSETLRPTYVVRDDMPADPARPWMILVSELPKGTDFDRVQIEDDRLWHASPQARMERLLRETKVSIGLLFNQTAIRLVYAPAGENSGHMTFPVAHMAEVAGRPILSALHLLISDTRLFTEAPERRLPAILANSRKFQSSVSNQLAEQVLAALYEILRGFQAADHDRRSELLREILQKDPNQVYNGLLTVLMRLVFLLYAEDRGLISSSSVYVNHYSVSGLFERLRTDQGRFPDTMEQRFGAWAQLLTLFRLIYSGGSHGDLQIPPREGHLFNPERFPFLEGRKPDTTGKEDLQIPRVSDGVIFRVLHNLLILDGERLSYRTLDVEQIGSVYEKMMGFNLEVAGGKSIAIKAAKSGGAPACINLEDLLDKSPASRLKLLADETGQKLSGQAAKAIKDAESVEELLAALEKKIARNATPNVVPKGAMVLQPSDERRKSGSHYTPRSFTEPIVEKTLEPLLMRLGEKPKPEQILEFKVCDPAMGSGAFLVEACRQLGDKLVQSWHDHNAAPAIPPDEDEILHARRLVAQRCVYGLDKNPMAVDLAKLSLWLATLAKDHPFTFLDHALRHGEALVGLTRREIESFTGPGFEAGQAVFSQLEFKETIDRVSKYRREILEMAEDNPYSVKLKQQKLKVADGALEGIRQAGDLVCAAFFAEDKPKKRQARLLEFRDRYMDSRRGQTQTLPPLLNAIRELREGGKAAPPFHWEIEFPEVFDRENGGFDAIVGNPPYGGKNTVAAGHRDGYLDWLKAIHEESHGNSDIVAHFYRRAFTHLRKGGCFGLIATNTIRQGDTRYSGLRWICVRGGGTIYAARSRYKWPGAAAVVVSVVWAAKGKPSGPFDLDGRPVPIITAYLFHNGGHENPLILSKNRGLGFKGCEIGSLGFLITQNHPLFDQFSQLKDPRDNRKKILKPYVTGEDLNASASTPRRFVLDVDGLNEAQMNMIPKVRGYLQESVRPDFLNRGEVREETIEWWNFRRPSLALRETIGCLSRMLAVSRVSDSGAFTFMSGDSIANSDIICFRFDSFSAFAILKSRCHETWARFFASSMKDDLRYTPTDCFDTFPFPIEWEREIPLLASGREYYNSRTALLIRHDEGLTKIYNRFHDPEESGSEILQLRDLHAQLDAAVLSVYDWADLIPQCQCEFLLDYDDEEEDDEDGGRRNEKKKPWRYRWPDEVRDEVLARLLDLNQKHAKEECQKHSGNLPVSRRKSVQKRNKSDDSTATLF